MPRASAAQTILPFGDPPEEMSRRDRHDGAEGWEYVLLARAASHAQLSYDIAKRSPRGSLLDGDVLIAAERQSVIGGLFG